MTARPGYGGQPRANGQMSTAGPASRPGQWLARTRAAPATKLDVIAGP
jgi:hypothetical protein